MPGAAKEGGKLKTEDKFARIRTEGGAVELCRDRARKSMCQCLTLSMRDHRLEIEEASVTRLILAEAKPTILHGHDDEPLLAEEWHEALERLLQIWV